jgi:hypothetical protein
MRDVLVILNKEDLPSAKTLADRLDDYTVNIYDPILVDLATDCGLRNINFIEWAESPWFTEISQEAHLSAEKMESELAEALDDLPLGVSIVSWQHLQWYYFFLQVQWYQKMWVTLLGGISCSMLHVFVCDKPQLYYFNSFLPSLLLLREAQNQGIQFSAYSYGSRPDPDVLVPNILDTEFENAEGSVLVHIPTCFYDVHHFNRELEATGKKITNFRSILFDVPVTARRHIEFVPIQQGKPPSAQTVGEILTPATARIKAILLRTMQVVVGVGRFAENQADYVALRYLQQFFTFFRLKEQYAHSRPSKLVISDHDAGFHGPLFSLASHYGIPVVTLPHSKFTYDFRHRHENITSLTHAIQVTEIHNGYGRRVNRAPVAYPEAARIGQPQLRELRKIGILLNAISLNGVLSSNYAKYVFGLREIDRFCRSQQLAFEVRGKLGYTISILLQSAVGLEKTTIPPPAGKTLLEFAAECELCLMFGAPTSAMLEFLSLGVPVLNPITEELTPTQLAGTHPDLIPIESVQETLARIAVFKKDPGMLLQFAVSQNKKLCDLLAEAKPMRSYI